MEKNETSYKGILKAVPRLKIYLSIDHLIEGKHTLHLTYKGKIIKTIHFKK